MTVDKKPMGEIYHNGCMYDYIYNLYVYNNFGNYSHSTAYLQYTRNLKSVLNNPAIAWEKVKNEVNAGRIAGPFSYRTISNLRVSPIGLVPKKTGGIRLITNLSSPINGSVNDCYLHQQITNHQDSDQFHVNPIPFP
jgi:hypothetical protein